MTSPVFVPVFLEIRYDPSTPTQPQQTVVIPDRLANSLPIYGLQSKAVAASTGRLISQSTLHPWE